MGWENPPIRWGELERAYAGEQPQPGDGNDSPAWTRKREPYRKPDEQIFLEPTDSADGDQTPRYAELHCHSNFSFLDGASAPRELVETAAELGLDAIALTDHDGMYGVVRFAEAARELGVRTLYGAELSLGLSKPQNGFPDPEGTHLLLLARAQRGYSALCKAITEGQLGSARVTDKHGKPEKGKPVYDLEQLAETLGEDCLVLTGCRKGAVRQALSTEGPAAAARELRRLVALFGRDSVFVELTDHGLPDDDRRNDLLAGIAEDIGCPTVATGAVHYATPQRGRLAAAMAAVRSRRSLEELDGWLPPAPMAYLRSGAEMHRRFERYPGAVQRAALLGVDCSFDLLLDSPGLPPFSHPEGKSEEGQLRERIRCGAAIRYGSAAESPMAHGQIDHELTVIEKLGFSGYFLIVDEIVDFCHEQGILCQGRGSAANSAVCYALGITKVDPVRWELLFERFLAPERDGYPDIDLDIESDRREEVIQHVYAEYGRNCAAQVANVITYRSRNAVRDMARALGYSTGQQDAWSKQIDRWGPLAKTAKEDGYDIPEDVFELAKQIEDAPRHLGIHSGGMVLCARPVSEVCPVEWARMENRSVLQWDKDDCATAGLVKFDLLGLGMLSALHYMIDLVAEHHGTEVDLAELDLGEKAVYEMLQRADSVGVFQVESRAQMATLPRLHPEEFYDLVIEVALIRPGPIQGGSVHPFIRRKNKKGEEWDYDHPLLENALKKTKGVPLFQEQLMQMAVDIAGFDAAAADELRRAMGAKRSTERMAKLKDRLYDGMKDNGITGELADKLYNKLLAFANFGFPESHALSFALLVFASAWFKLHYPAAFCAALLRAQPMGFYSPQSLVTDARRHGVVVRGPDINASDVQADLEPEESSTGEKAVRTGLATVRTIGKEVAERIVTERRTGGWYRDMADFAQRLRLRADQLEALATAGAFECCGTDRRAALWGAGAAAQIGHGELPDTIPGVRAPALAAMEPIERAVADVWATGLSPDTFPTEFVRDQLAARDVVPANELAEHAGQLVNIGGAVTHRQRPATAGGVTFMSVEDETGIANVICTLQVWQRYRRIARTSQGLLIRGLVEHADGVTNLLAKHMEPLNLRVPSTSRDFH